MIDEELLKDFIQHRKEIKKPLTSVAEKRMRMRLERFGQEGQDVNALLEKSILNGWQDVWPEKGEARPASHKLYVEHATTTTTPEVAREAVRDSIQLLRGGKQ
jgi:hypothetical protein